MRKMIFRCIVLLYLCFNSTSVLAWGVSCPYWSDNPLQLSPGQTYDFHFTLVNSPEGEPVTVSVSVTQGSEYVELTDSSTTYFVPTGPVFVDVNMRASIPSTSIIGDVFPIRLLFHEIGGSLNYDVGFPIVVVDSDYPLNAFSLISPIDSSIIILSSPTFAWHSTIVPEFGFVTSYNIIWDEDQAFDTPDSTGTQPDTVYTLPDSLIRSTRYYWRVIASNSHSVPRYSNETWNFYIDGYPTSPEIIYPENGSNADSSTYLVWLIGTDPDPFDTVTYSLQADDDFLFGSPEIDVVGITDFGFVLDEAVAIRLGELDEVENLQENQTYYWRVRSDDLFGLSSEWTPGPNYFIYTFPASIPTLTEWGMIILALLILAVGTVAVIRRRRAVTAE